MPDPSDPTRTSHEPPRTPPEPDTRDAPPVPEPATTSAVTHSHGGDPCTATLPPAGAREPVVEPPGFVVVREIGSGGMGVVYEARQTKLNRSVALKVLRGTRGSTQDMIRFLAEAEAVAAIKHPHVVQVFDHGQHADSRFIVFELLTGGTLSDRLRDGRRFAPRDAAALVAKLAEAVQAAHDLGIVHRDLKPGNVLFDEKGEPKITDFGLAKKTGGVDLTRTQAVMGTPAYMAPEQARGETRFVGPAADIWALGTILYECLTGKRAFDADDTWAILRKVTDESPSTPRTHVPGLPRDLELIALKCLEKNPADRYPSAAALVADLESYLSGRPVSVRAAGPLERMRKWVRRNPVIAAATAAVALALVIGSAVSLAFAMQAQRRGDDLAQANSNLTSTNNELTRANDDLGKANDDLKSARDTQAKLNDVLKNARAGLLKQASELIEANAAAGERGYLSDIALAHQLWKANDLRGMRAALERCPPGYRRWEWHYLDRLSRPEREVIATDSVPLALAYSPDGKRLAFLTRGGTLIVRELATGRESSFTADRPDGLHRALAFRPDGKELAITLEHRHWRVNLEPWEVKELTLKKEPLGSAIYALGYAKDNRLLGATARYPGIDKEWVFTIRDLASGEEVATLNSGVKSPRIVAVEVGGAAFSPDCTRFAASLIDSGLRVGMREEIDKAGVFQPVVMAWEIESKKLVDQTEGSGRLGTLVFDPNGRKVGFGRTGLSGELDSTLAGPARLYGGHTGDVLAVAFDKNGLIWSGGEDKLIRGHDRTSVAERFLLRGCSGSVVRLAVSPDGKEVAAAAGDLLAGNGAIHRFDVAAMAADVWRTPSARNHITLVGALSTDGGKAAISDFSLDGKDPIRATLRDIVAGTERPFADAKRFFNGVFHPDGGFVFLDQKDEIKEKFTRLQFVGADGKPGRSLEVPRPFEMRYPRSVVASSAAGTLATVTGAEDAPKKVRLGVWVNTWDAAGKPGKTAFADLSGVVSNRAMSGGIYPMEAAFDATGQKLAAAFALLWDKDGRGNVEQRGAVLVWDITTGEESFRQITLDPMRAVGFDPEGRVVAAGGNPSGGIVYGWNAETGERAFVMLGHTRPVLSLAFGPNGRLATGGADRVVKVWDMASRREVLTLEGFARDVAHLAFTKDGKSLVAATGLDWLTAVAGAAPPADFPPAEIRTFRGPK